MRIRFHDAQLLADLLSFMREAGCIAYQADAEEIEVMSAGGDAEAAEITALLERWTADHPGAEPEIVQGLLSP